MNVDRRHAGIQAIKVRAKHNGGRQAVQLMHRPAQAQALHQHGARSVPEPAAVQPGLGKIDKGLPRQRPALSRTERRKTKREIGVHHTPARQHHSVKNIAQAHAQKAHPRQRQGRQQPHKNNAGMRAQTAQALKRPHAQVDSLPLSADESAVAAGAPLGFL